MPVLSDNVHLPPVPVLCDNVHLPPMPVLIDNVHLPPVPVLDLVPVEQGGVTKGSVTYVAGQVLVI